MTEARAGDEDATTDQPEDAGSASAWPPLRRLGERGRYHLEERIAAGAAATVWRAYDAHLDRSVAVKILHPHLVADIEMVGRFERESRNAARLHHPNAIRIFDSDRIGDVVFLVMEYVDGPTLKQLIASHGAFPDWQTVAAIGEQIAAALGEAHRQGLIHRDIKPANILVTSDGVVKVVDFGIAKALTGASSDLTAEGTTVGTAAYIAPEQYSGAPVDERVDIYALGMVLHECLSGRPAFAGDTPSATAAARLTRDVLPPRQIRSDVDRKFDDIIVRTTRREPDDRYGDAELLARALRDLRKDGRDARELTRQLVLSRPPTNPSRHESPDVDPDAVTDPSMTTPGGSKRRLALAFGAGAVLTIVAATLILPGSDTPEVGPSDVGATATIQVARDFDPDGDGVERGGDVAQAFDKILSTSWSTETYRGSSQFGDKKPGVGIWFDLGVPTEVTAVAIDVVQPGVEMELYAADVLPDPDDGIIGWPPAIRDSVRLEEQASKLLFDQPVQARYWLVWITDLVEVEDGRFRASIAEIRFEVPITEPSAAGSIVASAAIGDPYTSTS